MVNSSKPNPTKYQVRSVSLPSCRSHPSTIRIEQELNKIKTWEVSCVPSEKSVSDGLIGLSTLYVCLDDLLNLSSTQEALSHIQKREWVDDLLDRSITIRGGNWVLMGIPIKVKNPRAPNGFLTLMGIPISTQLPPLITMLDLCGVVRNMVSQVKENIINLQCVLRRRKGDSNVESNIASYIIFRKKIKKDAKRLVADLKKLKSIKSHSLELNLDHRVISVIQILIEVNGIMVSVLELILLYFTTLGFKTKPARWSLVSKLMHKEVILACEDQQEIVNDMEKVDVALFNTICKNGSNNEGKKLQIAQKSLMAFEVHVESIEEGLECMFRHLIRTRASLLNITSH